MRVLLGNQFSSFWVSRRSSSSNFFHPKIDQIFSPTMSVPIRIFILLSLCVALCTIQLDALASLAERRLEARQFTVDFVNFKTDYSMLVPSEDECPKGTLLMVAVLSRRSGWDRRNSIRQTYARHLMANQVIKFIVGQAASEKQQNGTEQILLAEEQRRFGDIVFYGMEDSYDNLTLKVLASMQWQQAFCSEAKFLLKIDDDVLADLPRLGHWLEGKFLPELARRPNLVLGHVLSRRFGNAQEVIRDPENKWHLLPEDYPNVTFPDYADGPSYLLSTGAVAAILGQVPSARFIRIEDVLFTGILRDRAKVGLIDAEPFIQIYCGLIDCPNDQPSKSFAGLRFNLNDVYTRIEQNYKALWNNSQPVARRVRTEVDDGGTELNCRLELQRRCSGGVPITSVWCPGSKMRLLADYKAVYGQFHSIECEKTEN